VVTSETVAAQLVDWRRSIDLSDPEKEHTHIFEYALRHWLTCTC